MRISSLVLYAIDVAATAEFYRQLGVEFHPAGPGRLVADVGGCRFAISPSSSGDTARQGGAGTVMPGIDVGSVDTAIGRVISGGGTVLRAAETLDWGRRAVLLDPDGRAVEIVERSA
ncbi:MAG: VOC family protein [Acidimicrobiia bacterium]